MSSFTRKSIIWISLGALICLVVVLAAPSPVVPGAACQLGTTQPCYVSDFSQVPAPLVDEANSLAKGLFGNNRQKCQDFTSQLLGMYILAKDVDLVIINNSGGFGWSSLEDAPHGSGFIQGVNEVLSGMGYKTLWLNYYRTPKTLGGSLSEFMFAFGLYPQKAHDLSVRIKFLTDHLPNIKIILDGESNGCALCTDILHLLGDNPQVYTIEMGPPPLDHSASSDRSLILRTNGFTSDSFSEGDLITIFRSNLESLLGISPEYPGNILLYIGAPGHDYAWEYPGVGPVIADFLENSLGKNVQS